MEDLVRKLAEAVAALYSDRMKKLPDSHMLLMTEGGKLTVGDLRNACALVDVLDGKNPMLADDDEELDFILAAAELDEQGEGGDELEG